MTAMNHDQTDRTGWLTELRQLQIDAVEDERAEQELAKQLRCERDFGTITDWQLQLLNEYERSKE